MNLRCTSCGADHPDVVWLNQVEDDPRYRCLRCGFISIPPELRWGHTVYPWAKPICPHCGSAYTIGVKYRNWKPGLPVRYLCLVCKLLFLRRKQVKPEWRRYVEEVVSVGTVRRSR